MRCPPTPARVLIAAAVSVLALLLVTASSSRPGTLRGPGQPPTPHPAGSTAPQASGAPQATSGGDPFAGRIPHFPAAPTPQPVMLHPGAQAQFFSRVPTSQPVAFLTIDDGFVQQPA